ncbi:hypothetical protein KCU99_g5853, partial [Aureobasidium melanogenum]
MDSDDLNTAHQDQLISWCTHFDEKYGYPGVERLASRYRDGQRCRGVLKVSGSFNLCVKVVFDDDQAWAVRFPVPGRVMHPEEKLRREVAVLRYIEHNTRIPVPTLIAFGSGLENEDPEVGPFVITTWVEGVSLQSLLEELPRPKWGPVLREDIDDEIFYKIYSQMADILLELASTDFNKIGSLTMSKDNNQPTWSIVTRPLTIKMNEIESDDYVVVDDHTTPPFDNATDYMEHLLQQSTKHLYDQRNSIEDAEDARREFIVRRRMQALLPYFRSRYDSGPFKLYCDDIHPRNILVDSNTYQITAVIDWEWTYTAPQDFSYTIPSWLILEKPSAWIESSKTKFKKQTMLFTQALEEAERKREQSLSPELLDEGRMSTAMRKSFEDGTFWFKQMLLSVHTFDGEVYWPRLEPYLEKRGLLDVGVPDEEEVQQFVSRKMEDLEAYNKELEEKNKNKTNEQQIESEVGWKNQLTGYANFDTTAVEAQDSQHVEPGIDSTSQPRNQANTSLCDRTDNEAASSVPSHTSTIADNQYIEQVSISAHDHADNAAADLAELQPKVGGDKTTTTTQEIGRQRTWLETFPPSCVFN